MASALSITTVSRSGVDEAASLVAADAGGNYWNTTGVQWLAAKNGSGAPITISLTIQQTVDGQTPPARTVSVPAGKTYYIGPFPSAYNDANAPARANVTYSGVTSLTVGVFQLGS